MTRRGAEMAIAFLFAGAIIVVGGGAVFFVLTISPAFTDPATVPSTAAATQPGQYSGAVDESRRLARALVVEENLPGLSLAVAVDGELVWAEGFGWADVERRAPVTPRLVYRARVLPGLSGCSRRRHGRRICECGRDSEDEKDRAAADDDDRPSEKECDRHFRAAACHG